MTGNDAVFDMDAALETATDFGLALVDKYRDELRGLADTGQTMNAVGLLYYVERFGASCGLYTRHVLSDALLRGASQDEATLVAYAFTDACQTRLMVLSERGGA